MQRSRLSYSCWSALIWPSTFRHELWPRVHHLLQMSTRDFDVMVIGGGGAGYAAASTAARHGARVAMIEDWKLGGTCLNVGCVPSKTLLRSAHVWQLIQRASEFGIDVGQAQPNFQAIMQRKDDVIRGFSGEGPEESL